MDEIEPDGFPTEGPAEPDGYDPEAWAPDGPDASGRDLESYGPDVGGVLDPYDEGTDDPDEGPPGQGPVEPPATWADGSPAATFLEEGLLGDGSATEGRPGGGLPEDGQPDDEPALGTAGEPDDGSPESTAPARRDVDASIFGTPVDGPGDAPIEPDDPTGLPLFPPVLTGVELPPPVDGPPWVDPSSLGVATAQPDVLVAGSAELLSDLRESSAQLGAGWGDLGGSADPAVRALARLWAPPD